MRRISLTTTSLFFTAALLAACNGGKGVDSGTPVDTDTSSGLDADGDGYGADDCDDNDASVNPGADEDCDGIDNDCNGEIDEGVTGTYYEDADADGFGDAGSFTDACEAATGYVPNSDDCDDTDPYIYPDAEEICDGLDNDCDGTPDDGLDTDTYYHDGDGDGYGDPGEPADLCELTSGYVDNDWDCDDLDSGEPVHADTGGSASGTGTSADPMDSIQDAIDMSDACVFAAAGTYNEDINFNGKDILVRGMGGPDKTYIIGTGDDAVVTFENGESSAATLTGFTVTGGGGASEETTTTTDPGSPGEDEVTTTYIRHFGGGIFVDGASPTLYDLVVTENSLPAYSDTNVSDTEEIYVFSYGGGIFVGGGGSIEPYSVTVSMNTADNGGGTYVGDGSTLDGMWMVYDGNSASSGGGVAAEGSTSLSDGAGGGVGGAGVDVIGGSATLNYVTAVGNDGIAAMYVASGGSATVWNSILADNDAGYMVDGDVGTSLEVMYSDVYGGSSGEYGSVYTDPTGSDGNISDDPLFTDWSDDDDYSNDDLSLASGSPAIDAADSSDSDTDGSAADMGAWGGPEGDWE